MESGKRRSSGKEIQSIIEQYHPIDIRTIQRLTQPTMKLKNVRKALGHLRNKNVVDMLVGSDKSFYYQPLHVWRDGSPSMDSDFAPMPRRQNLFHDQWCYYWEAMMKREVPELKVVRECNIANDDFSKSVLRINGEDIEALPDLLLLLPLRKSDENVCVAVEIERTRKSDKRILRKLRTYAEETHLDGLIYICDTARLANTIRSLYENGFLAKSKRIRNYGKHFFLFSDCMSASDRPFDRLFNADAEPVQFSKWLNELRSTERNFRRDDQFR